MGQVWWGGGSPCRRQGKVGTQWEQGVDTVGGKGRGKQ